MNQVSVHALLANHAVQQAGQPALVGEGWCIAYADLADRIEALARWLAKRGVAAGDIVAISISDEIEHLVCAMALLCLGTVHVNLPTHETAANNRAIAGRLDVRRVVAHRRASWMEGVETIIPDFAGSLAEAASAPFAGDRANLFPTRALDSPALYRNTSGSTSVPKSFAVSLERVMLAVKQHQTPNQRRVLRTSSMEFDSSRFYRICSLLAGNTGVFSPNLDLATLGDLCEHAEVSEIHIGTYKLSSLVRSSARNFRRLPEFTRVMTGGSRVPGYLRREIAETLTTNLWISYATSEIGPISVATPAEHERFPEGVGLPMSGVEVEIVGRDDEPVTRGTVGQIRIRKRGAPNNYVSDPAASSSFRQGWFYPRDLLAWPEGGPLVFHGRADDMMILNGINIFPSAIEDTLESDPSVREALAYPIKSRIHGEIPVAAIVLREDAEKRDVPYYMDLCRRALGVRGPRQIFIVDSIPRTSLGKPLRRELTSSS
jgi:acyl-CoA synthetase (AMP-forming)/AMP-acid ligase II